MTLFTTESLVLNVLLWPSFRTNIYNWTTYICSIVPIDYSELKPSVDMIPADVDLTIKHKNFKFSIPEIFYKKWALKLALRFPYLKKLEFMRKLYTKHTIIHSMTCDTSELNSSFANLIRSNSAVANNTTFITVMVECSVIKLS